MIKRLNVDRILQIVLGVMMTAVLAVMLLVPQPEAQETGTVNDSPLTGRLIVIDPGHGGYDGGTNGTSLNTREADINLAISLLLRQKLESVGASVIMTRETEDAVAGRKQEDMAKRREIIRSSNADIVLSIHQNSHPNGVYFGPQIFYAEGSEKGKILAQTIQQAMNEALNTEKPRAATAGDYYILNSGSMPCVIIESGFLSNYKDEKNLREPAYQDKVAESILNGTLAYFRDQE